MNDALDRLRAKRQEVVDWLTNTGKSHLIDDYPIEDWWIYQRCQKAIKENNQERAEYYVRLATHSPSA